MMSELKPGPEDLWFLPLGGTGEIGMNMNLYGHDGHWMMVDCGVTFEEPKAQEGNTFTENRVICADPQFIVSRRQRLAGLVITHAHEDHVGAVADLWRQLKCPVYASPFTAAVLQRKLAQKRLANRVPVHVINPGEGFNVGPFELEWIHLTHSIPEPQALLIRTPLGAVFHTADWKLDPHPVIGKRYDESRYRQLAREHVLAMVCDSTNATTPGHSVSEGELIPGLSNLISQAPGRVVVCCFGSNVARLQTLAKIAAETGRHMGLLGRSLQNMVAIARQTGYWPETLRLCEPGHLGFLPREEVLAVATGSQGEPRTALSRLARGSHPDLDLEPGDRVIFSSKVIPGNEAAVARVISQLRGQGIEVIEADDSELPIHASGHPCEDELRKLYDWVKPTVAVPTHGEERHLLANARIAREANIPEQLVGFNGDLFELHPRIQLHRHATETGIIDLQRD